MCADPSAQWHRGLLIEELRGRARRVRLVQACVLWVLRLGEGGRKREWRVRVEVVGVGVCLACCAWNESGAVGRMEAVFSRARSLLNGSAVQWFAVSGTRPDATAWRRGGGWGPARRAHAKPHPGCARQGPPPIDNGANRPKNSGLMQRRDRPGFPSSISLHPSSILHPSLVLRLSSFSGVPTLLSPPLSSPPIPVPQSREGQLQSLPPPYEVSPYCKDGSRQGSRGRLRCAAPQSRHLSPPIPPPLGR